jgi:hypothetical protein
VQLKVKQAERKEKEGKDGQGTKKESPACVLGSHIAAGEISFRAAARWYNSDSYRRGENCTKGKEHGEGSEQVVVLFR